MNRFHPSATKLLACAVDTEGYLGFWDIEQVQDEEPVVFQYKPHTRTITDMHFNPVDNSKLLTSSYDGLIRTYDMNKAEFDTLDMGLDKYPITGFDSTKDGHSVTLSLSLFLYYESIVLLYTHFYSSIALVLYFQW
jgi:WD40 repeat protein